MTEIVLCLALVAMALFALRRTSFAAQPIDSYATAEPGFELDRHLAGPLLSEGVIFGPTGKTAARFTARMHGEWHGDTATLNEEFRFASGARQLRCWHITRGTGGAFSATAEDVIGTARGQCAGNAIRMRYKLRLEADAGGHVLNVTDWLFLMPDGSIINRSEFRKFGLKLGELVATIRPAQNSGTTSTDWRLVCSPDDRITPRTGATSA